MKDVFVAIYKAALCTLVVIACHTIAIGIARSEEDFYFYDDAGVLAPCVDGGCYAFKPGCTPGGDGLCASLGKPCTGAAPALVCKCYLGSKGGCACCK